MTHPRNTPASRPQPQRPPPTPRSIDTDLVDIDSVDANSIDTDAIDTDAIDTDLDPRSIRARVEEMTVRQLRDGRYVVETDGGTYVVDLVERTCTCPDQAIRHERCKHLRRVAIEIVNGSIDAPTWGICASCGARVTDRHESNADRERPLCAGCRLEPGDLVRDRETGGLLVVETVTDEAAGDVVLPATGERVADHPTNEAYGAHEPVVEAVYLDDFLEAERNRWRAGDESPEPADRQYDHPDGRSNRQDRRPDDHDRWPDDLDRRPDDPDRRLDQRTRRYSFPFTRLQRVPDGRAWLAAIRPRPPLDRVTGDRSRTSVDRRASETVQTTLGAIT